MTSSIKKRFVLLHRAGHIPEKRRPLDESLEGVLRLLQELDVLHPDGVFTVCEITWDDDLWASDGRAYLKEHEAWMKSGDNLSVRKAWGGV